MDYQWKHERLPGGTILGGAAGGFSYEGARYDALAREDAAWRRAERREAQERRAEAGCLAAPRAKAPAKV